MCTKFDALRLCVHRVGSSPARSNRSTVRSWMVWGLESNSLIISGEMTDVPQKVLCIEAFPPVDLADVSMDKVSEHTRLANKILGPFKQHMQFIPLLMFGVICSFWVKVRYLQGMASVCCITTLSVHP